MKIKLNKYSDKEIRILYRIHIFLSNQQLAPIRDLSYHNEFDLTFLQICSYKVLRLTWLELNIFFLYTILLQLDTQHKQYLNRMLRVTKN